MEDTTSMVSRAGTPQFIGRDEGRIAYEVFGAGPLVVCLPGMGELRSVYRFTVPALVAAGLRVATMDLRGHGDSDATFVSYDDVAAAQDALALITHLGGPAVVVGNSMGAGAAVWAAAEQPQVVAGLVLIGPFVRNVPTNPLVSLAFRLAMAGPWAPSLWRAYLPTLYPGGRPADFVGHLEAIAAGMRRSGHARAFRATTRTSHAPVEARLSEVTAPALVVMGERDPDFSDPVGEARRISDRLGAEVLLVPRAGHFPHVESPGLVNPTLVEFVARMGQRG